MATQSPKIIALGNFDGIHRGHRQVIDSILNLPSGVPVQGTPTVVSFDPHPREFFTGTHQLLLTPLAEKRDYLKVIGVDELILLPFDAAMARLTPREFVERILIDQLQAQWVSVGQNFRFGHRRAGTTEDLRAIATEHNIPVHIASLYRCEGDRISSSAIRRALVEGEISSANRLLGRPYTLIGTVTQGQQLGRTIGFPTANLALPPDKFLPRQGVYAVNVILSTAPATSSTPTPPTPLSSLPGVMNIGNRPTVDGLKQTFEVHLLDWSGDLYGQQMTVQLQAFLRPEQKFDSLDDLKVQIAQDCEKARSLKLESPEA